MPTVKQLGISIAIAMAIVGAGAFGISAIERSAAQVPTDRFAPSKTVPEITADAPQLQS